MAQNENAIITIEQPLSLTISQYTDAAIRGVLKALDQLEVCPTAKALLMHYMAQDVTGRAGESSRELAQMFDCSHITIQRARKELEAAGLIRYERPNRRNHAPRITITRAFEALAHESTIGLIRKVVEHFVENNVPREGHSLACDQADQEYDLNDLDLSSKDTEAKRDQDRSVNLTLKPPIPPLGPKTPSLEFWASCGGFNNNTVEGHSTLNETANVESLSPLTTVRTTGPRFKLRSNDPKQLLARARKYREDLPEWAIQWVLKNCFFSNRAEARRSQITSARATIRDLLELRADLLRLDEFVLAWRKWTNNETAQPTSGQLTKHWRRMMKLADEMKETERAESAEQRRIADFIAEVERQNKRSDELAEFQLRANYEALLARRKEQGK